VSTSTKDLKKLAQAYLRDQGFYSGDIDGIWGKLSKKAFDRYMDHLNQLGVEIGGESVFVEDGVQDTVSGVVVLDPGHGGSSKIGGSSSNNAISSSGVLEKTMTLSLAKLVQKQLTKFSDENPGADIKVHLTRSGDSNLSLSDRAQTAVTRQADVFLSIHFNGFNGSVRGTETLILSTANGNVNEGEDLALAQRVQTSTLTAIRGFDANARDRGVKKDQRLGVLNDISLGNTRSDHKTRACLLEVEFIDNPDVDELLNTGPSANAVQAQIASALAAAIIDDLRANT
jgi:N-acetylmuramoyl-L-alanine amidase